jgi:hypothetical protein
MFGFAAYYLSRTADHWNLISERRHRGEGTTGKDIEEELCGTVKNRIKEYFCSFSFGFPNQTSSMMLGHFFSAVPFRI